MAKAPYATDETLRLKVKYAHGGQTFIALMRPVSSEAIDDVILKWAELVVKMKEVIEDDARQAAFGVLSAELAEIDGKVFMPVPLPEGLLSVSSVGSTLTPSDKASLASITSKATDGTRSQYYLSGGAFDIGLTSSQDNWRLEGTERAGLGELWEVADEFMALVVTRSGATAVCNRYINLSLARRRITARRT